MSNERQSPVPNVHAAGGVMQCMTCGVRVWTGMHHACTGRPVYPEPNIVVFDPVAELRARIAELEAENADLRGWHAEFDAANEGLGAAVVELRAENARLQEAIAHSEDWEVEWDRQVARVARVRALCDDWANEPETGGAVVPISAIRAALAGTEATSEGTGKR